MDIGEFPTKDESCSKWNTSFYENGILSGNKNYRLCRSEKLAGLYVDEGNNVTLQAQWLNQQLISPFRLGNTLLVSIDRLTKARVFQEEIFSFRLPSTNDCEQTVRSIKLTNLQRMTLTSM
jgi:hypothetical protein